MPILEKTKDTKRIGDLERAVEELREDVEEKSRYVAAFLSTRKEKKISLNKIVKKYSLKIR